MAPFSQYGVVACPVATIVAGLGRNICPPAPQYHEDKLEYAVKYVEAEP